MKLNKTFSFLLILLLTSCWIDEGPDFIEGEVMGYKPLYDTEVDMEVAVQDPRTVVNSGKIYLFNDLVLLNEISEGIHIIDNSDPENPRNLAFLKVGGSTDMAIRNGIMYVNQYNDMIAVDFRDLENISVLSRSQGVLNFDDTNQYIPPGQGNYFECIDESKGRVIGWQFTTLDSPKCFR